MPPHKAHKKRSSHRSTLSLQKTEVVIHVYDLLTPGRWSTLLWHMGTSLLHSGVVINGREYAYGGHARAGVTGVYWTEPRTAPPGGTFRCEILQGFTLATPAEIDAIVRSAADEFLGPAYNLLTKNCNHFTAYLCRRLTGRPGPAWLNRAATIGMALPCVVPREWVDPELEAVNHGGPPQPADDGRDSDDDDRDDRDSADLHSRYSSDDGCGEHSSMLRPSSARQMHLVGLDDGSGRNSPAPTASTRTSTSSRPSTDYAPSRHHSRESSQHHKHNHHSHHHHHPEPFDEEGAGDAPSPRRKGKARAAGVARDAAGHALPPAEQVPAP